MRLKDIVIGLAILIMLSTLNWEWSNVKSFVSGGVIAVCFIRRLIHE